MDGNMIWKMTWMECMECMEWKIVEYISTIMHGMYNLSMECIMEGMECIEWKTDQISNKIWHV